MKKLICCIALAVLLFSSTGCSSGKTNKGNSGAGVGLPQTQVGETSESKVLTEQFMQLPVVQEAYELWISFGGHPPFSTPEELTADSAAGLYANYCENNKTSIMFVQDYDDIKMDIKWIPAIDLERFISDHFEIRPEQIRETSDYYNPEKGYRYPVPVAAQADEHKILSVEDIGDSRLEMKIEYVYKLPSALYDPANQERRTIFTVIFSSKNNSILFHQANFRNIL